MKFVLFIVLLSLFSLLVTGCARVITSGNYHLKSGTSVPGHLIITSGQVVLDEGSEVAGSVFMTSGDLVAGGEIEGNIWMTSGNVYIGPEAVVHGSVKGASGNVQQAEGAQVLGDVSTDFGSFSFGKFLVLAGAAFYFLITGGRRSVGREKQPPEWKEKSGEKSSYI